MGGSQQCRLKVGTVLEGRYEILRSLGLSGCAETYEANQLNIDHVVAVRVMDIVLEGPGSEEIGARFAKEVEISTHLSDPGIVTILDLGVTEVGLPYLVTEPLSGHTLREYLDTTGNVEPLRALRLMMGCLEALAKAHQVGLLHRDLKPENLYVCDPNTSSERISILGFGLAALNEDSAGHVTHFGLKHGTPRYLAPETIVDGQISAACDVYQLGLVLVELLVGGRLIPEDNPFLCCQRHVTGDLGVPDVLFDSPLGPVLHKALARDVQQRFQTAGEFRDALADVMSHMAADSLAEVAGTEALLDGLSPVEAQLAYSLEDWAENLGDAAGRIEEILTYANDDWVVEVFDGVEPDDFDFEGLDDSAPLADLSGFIFPAKLEQVMTRDPATRPAPLVPEPVSSIDDELESIADCVQPAIESLEDDSREWLAPATERRKVGDLESENNLMGRGGLAFSGLGYEDYLEERKSRREAAVAAAESDAGSGSESDPTQGESQPQSSGDESRRPRSSFATVLIVAGIILTLLAVVLIYWFNVPV